MRAEVNASDAFERLRRAVDSRPDQAARFEPPLPDAERHALLAGLDDVPPALIELLRWRDGTRPNRLDFAGFALKGARGIAESKSGWDELAAAHEDPRCEAPLQGALWHPKWLPVASNDESVIALATNACFGEPAGFIVQVGFKPATGWSILHASLAEWLTFLARLVEEDLLDANAHHPRVDAIAKEVSPDARSFDLDALEGRFERDYR